MIAQSIECLGIPTTSATLQSVVTLSRVQSFSHLEKMPKASKEVFTSYLADFLPLKNYQVNARSASEIDYPWVARVLHSRVFSKPQLCTAVCIDKQIFITAARCVVLYVLTCYTTLYFHTFILFTGYILW